ncbi:MAG TPA: hypothetical protein VFH10_04770, partial [Nocardioides sp.]|uniref:hypothetical protein n=1 Tax=Nocardioides sp. TaxID=35761 RepID=UPI002D80F17F
VDRQFGIACGLRLTASRDNDSYKGMTKAVTRARSRNFGRDRGCGRLPAPILAERLGIHQARAAQWARAAGATYSGYVELRA